MEKQIIKFVLLSSQRSGSTFIRIWLNSHSNIYCYGEVFLGHYESPDGLKVYCRKRMLHRIRFKLHYQKIIRRLKLDILDKNVISNYLSQLFFDQNFPAPWTDINKRNSCLTKKNKNVIGFKIMSNTLEYNNTLKMWIDTHKPRIIHLIRRNLLKRYISMLRMSLSNIDHSTSIVDTQPVMIDINKFSNYLEKTTLKYEELRKMYSSNFPYMELTYESFFNEHQQEKERVLKFLDQSIEDMVFPEMKKISTSDIGKEIFNVEDVVSFLKNSKYESFLKEFGIIN